ICSLTRSMQTLQIDKMQKMRENATTIQQIALNLKSLSTILPAGVLQMIVDYLREVVKIDGLNALQFFANCLVVYRTDIPELNKEGIYLMSGLRFAKIAPEPQLQIKWSPVNQMEQTLTHSVLPLSLRNGSQDIPVCGVPLNPKQLKSGCALSFGLLTCDEEQEIQKAVASKKAAFPEC